MRTTLMIRNIPNKYDINLLLEEVNETFKGKFDFLYLPLDFDNQCNLGYAFINFIEHLHILYFYELFEGKKWKKFKSSKECHLTYAKFQGKFELTNHLEKTCVLNKLENNKRPIILTITEPFPIVVLPERYKEFIVKNHYLIINKFIFVK